MLAMPREANQELSANARAADDDDDDDEDDEEEEEKKPAAPASKDDGAFCSAWLALRGTAWACH